MGYNTDFKGQFNLDRPLTAEHAEYLRRFAETRRVKRSAIQASTIFDPTRERAGLPLGDDACYFTGGDRFSTISDNTPPRGQPGLYCQWVPTADTTGIEWDHSEKFYDFTEWLVYIVVPRPTSPSTRPGSHERSCTRLLIAPSRCIKTHTVLFGKDVVVSIAVGNPREVR